MSDVPGLGTVRATRRTFVHQCARACSGGGAALLTAMASACASVVVARVTPVEGRLRLRLAEHPTLARPGGAMRVLPEGATDPLIVLAHAEREFVVVSSVCTHRGCGVDIEGGGMRLVCPCHGSTYDRFGRVVVGPAERPLARFPARMVADGVLEIELETR